MTKTNKPKGVTDHWHWFRKTEDDRADICILNDTTTVIWFVLPDITVDVPSKLQAETLLGHLGYSKRYPDDAE